MDRPISVGALALELGAPALVEELAELSEAESTRELLLVGGLQQYLRSELSAVELAERSIGKTLASAGVDPGSVDLLVYATESARAEDSLSGELALMGRRLGLRRATPLGVGGAACANIIPALSAAVRAIRRGRARRVVVAMTDVVYAHESRVLPPALTVFSDGAASCLVSADEDGALDLRSLSYFADNTLWASSTLDLIKNLSAGIKQTTAQALSEAEVAARDCKKIVMNNYTSSVSRLFSISAGFKKEQMYRATVATHAHVGTADVLLNLRELISQGELGSGDRACVLSTGPSMCGAMVVGVR